MLAVALVVSSRRGHGTVPSSKSKSLDPGAFFGRHLCGSQVGCGDDNHDQVPGSFKEQHEFTVMDASFGFSTRGCGVGFFAGHLLYLEASPSLPPQPGRQYLRNTTVFSRRDDKEESCLGIVVGMLVLFFFFSSVCVEPDAFVVGGDYAAGVVRGFNRRRFGGGVLINIFQAGEDTGSSCVLGDPPPSMLESSSSCALLFWEKNKEVESGLYFINRNST